MSVPTPVLLVDDDRWACRLVTTLLGGIGIPVQAVGSAAAARATLAGGFNGIVVLEEQLPDTPGSEFYRWMRDSGYRFPVVFLTRSDSTDLAIRVIGDGAVDVVEKHSLRERLAPAVLLAVRRHAGHSQGLAQFGIVSKSPLMQAIAEEIVSALPSRIPVLIRGESGTGKELIARALHHHSPQRHGAYVAVNCAGIPGELLESELFGYEKGAFTGAVRRKPGRFELAAGGTLFLDEIGDLPAHLQGKLLRVLQEGEYQRLGGTETLRADARVVSATHRDLETDAAGGRFRQDLYFRLAAFTITLPALRQRLGDIPDLVAHLGALAARREGLPPPRFAPRVVDALGRHLYPGNIRELENLVAYAVVRARERTIDLGDLPETFLRTLLTPTPHPAAADERTTNPGREPAAGEPEAFPTLDELERQHIRAAMARTAGNRTEAAKLLGVSRMTLHRKLGASP